VKKARTTNLLPNGVFGESATPSRICDTRPEFDQKCACLGGFTRYPA